MNSYFWHNKESQKVITLKFFLGIFDKVNIESVISARSERNSNRW